MAVKFFPAQRGFTLLEIVVSVAILSMGVGLALQIFSGGLNNIERIRRAHDAMNHAENVMNEILTDHSVTTPTQLSGQLDDDFTYTALVDYWDPPQEQLTLDVTQDKVDLLSVVVEVHYRGDAPTKVYRMTCLKTVALQPVGPASDPSDVIRQLFGGR